MTIAVVIRTGSSVVFAADSKITTTAIAGFQDNGEPIWQEQTYDNATKVVHDRSKTLMAMVAGHANLGQVAATDFISTQSFEDARYVEDQDSEIKKLVEAMDNERQAYWKTTKVLAENWPGPTVLLAAPRVKDNTPRVWRVALEGPSPKIEEILSMPGIRLEGSYDEVFSLLYGYESNVLRGICEQLKVSQDGLSEAIRNLKVLQPIHKLNLWAMPVQDAIDMAVFLATVQVEMDRFLPGTPVCGGPIDVMVLSMAPVPGILPYPGKILRHPRGPQ